MRRVAADWIYIDFLQYYGISANRFDGGFRRIYPLCSEMLWLDPYFHFGVLCGASVLGWNLNRIGEAQRLLRQAIEVDPAYPRYKLYLAALTYTRANHDRDAIHYLEYLVQQPDRPENLLRILGNLYVKVGDWSGAKRYWLWVRSNTADPATIRLQANSPGQAAWPRRAHSNLRVPEKENRRPIVRSPGGNVRRACD